MTDNQPIKKYRITSIDALRAVTLLGIVIVHAFDGFGRGVLASVSNIDEGLAWFINTFLYGKCNTVFSMLFGVSFYLILRNPQYSSLKFLWRCFLLLLIGLCNKQFFTYDALMWYGICGMMLVLVRYMKPRYILVFFCLLIIATVQLHKLKLGTALFGINDINRYTAQHFTDILTYPYGVEDYLRGIFNHGIFGPFSLFVLGYWIAVKGYIEKLDVFVTGRVVLMFWAIYLVSFALPEVRGLRYFMRMINNYAATFAYASGVIYIYYHSRSVQSVLKLLEPYGKLGLTNYSMQGVIGVCVIWLFTTGVLPYTLWGTLLLFLCIYLLQALFSYVWLQYFRYGPMEYVWRVATERKLIEFRV